MGQVCNFILRAWLRVFFNLSCIEISLQCAIPTMIRIPLSLRPPFPVSSQREAHPCRPFPGIRRAVPEEVALSVSPNCYHGAAASCTAGARSWFSFRLNGLLRRPSVERSSPGAQPGRICRSCIAFPPPCRKKCQRQRCGDCGCRRACPVAVSIRCRVIRIGPVARLAR